MRAAGILLPVSALPSPYGIGAFGKDAYRWIDFLAEAGQTYWQILPLGGTSYGDSPYQSPSAFAGNPYFIDLDQLVQNGLLTQDECDAVDWGGTSIDYKCLFDHRAELLHRAFERFAESLDEFRAEHADWIEDYALFMSIKAEQNYKPWTEWPEVIRKKQRHEIDYHIFVQYLFFTQWAALKEYANQHGVYIIGDIPIYVAMDSADTWANNELFDFTEVAGCPPDYFSETGQLWGNPLYRWEVHKKTGYAWWIRRLRAALQQVDRLRIDHFRAFADYYAIPYGNKTAQGGRWLDGPGMNFFDMINIALDKPALIAEDLGVLSPAVGKLLADCGYPGMKILQFAFDSKEESNYMPHTYQRNCVVYTGTHDNDTTRGWYQKADTFSAQQAALYLGITDEKDAASAFIRGAMTSVADLVIVPFQDYLNLGSEARINFPSTLGGTNWRWRMQADVLTPELAKGIRALTCITGRHNG